MLWLVSSHTSSASLAVAVFLLAQRGLSSCIQPIYARPEIPNCSPDSTSYTIQEWLILFSAQRPCARAMSLTTATAAHMLQRAQLGCS